MAPKRKTAPEEPIPGSVSESDTGANQKNNTTSDTQEAQKEIHFDTAADPELNPSSPEFNEARYQAYLSTLDLSDLRQRIQHLADTATGALAASANKKILDDDDPAADALKELSIISTYLSERNITAFNSYLKPLLENSGDWIPAEWDRFIAKQLAAENRKKALRSQLKKELPKIQQIPGLEEITLDVLASFIGPDGKTVIEEIDGNPTPAPILDAVCRALADINITAKRADIVEYPLDKVNSNIWNMLQETTGRQMKMYIDTAKAGSKDKLEVFYSIDFSALENSGIKVTKQLTPFDKRVYIAISALFNAGNIIISSRQIYIAMGGSGEPSDNQTAKIRESVAKMRKADVVIDNIKEAELYKYERFTHRGFLLPADITTAEINGQIVNDAIRLSMEPPIMTFAKQRKQITTFTVKVLQSPVNKTDANLLIDDYLLERIGRAKHGGKSLKILYATLYENAQIKSPSQRTRAPEKVKKYLEHYKACGLISAYKMEKDGIQIEF